jgi:uncharacterized OsmC-like protein
MAKRNGVDVDKLLTVIEDVKNNPSHGRLIFRVKSEWKGGFRAMHTTSSYTVGPQTQEHKQNHTVHSDEPEGILGEDSAISPSEMILTTLASCLSVGYAANAAAMGIDLEEVSFEITGDGDLQGFMNLGNLRPGLTDVHVKTHIKANAPADKLKELHDYVNSHSPMWDTIANPVSVKSELIVK